MTPQQVILFTVLYGIAMVIAIYFTRATTRRIVGSLVGAAVAGLVAMGIIASCEALKWWHIPYAPTLFFAILFYFGLSVTLTPIYLITWRVARRWGWRGLAVFVGIVGVIGPPRDYMYAMTFPKWMVFAPGAAPIIADGVAYIAIVVIGHVAMRVVAGPSGKDSLAHRASKAA